VIASYKFIEVQYMSAETHLKEQDLTKLL